MCRLWPSLKSLTLISKRKYLLFGIFNSFMTEATSYRPQSTGFYTIATSVIKYLKVLIWVWLFHDGGRYHIETSPLICSANQWTGFYMITASVMRELTQRIIGSFKKKYEIDMKPLSLEKLGMFKHFYCLFI